MKGGVRIWEYQPAMMHAKTIVVDGGWLSVGSMNADNRSMSFNEESILWCSTRKPPQKWRITSSRILATRRRSSSKRSGSGLDGARRRESLSPDLEHPVAARPLLSYRSCNSPRYSPLSSRACLAAVLAGCSRDNGGSSQPGAPKSDQVWAPAKLTSVSGVPEAAIESALKARLAGARPPRIDDDQWGHVRRLYKIYGDNPLWLAPDGLHTERAFALTNALLNADTDGMRLDAYPIGELASAIAALKQSKTPTAQQLVEADVLLTSSFAALGEDYLTGPGGSEVRCAELAHRRPRRKRRQRADPLHSQSRARQGARHDAARGRRLSRPSQGAHPVPRAGRQGRMAHDSGGQGAEARRFR